MHIEIRMLCNIQDTYKKSIQNYFQKTYKTSRKVSCRGEDSIADWMSKKKGKNKVAWTNAVQNRNQQAHVDMPMNLHTAQKV